LFLIENGYDVVSNESLLINSSSSVRLLVNIAVFQTDPHNSTNISELLENLAEITGNSDNLSQHWVNSRGGKETNYVLELLRKSFPDVQWSGLGKESPYSFYSMLIHGLFQDSVEPHISFFLNEVLSFTQTKRKSMSDFLEFWIEKRSKLSIALEKNNDAISIITIHKSKGLEFPVVIHPYADYPTQSGKNFIWTYLDDNQLKPMDRIRISSTSSLEKTPFKEEYELETALESMDMFNELYVAATRAKDRLYLSGKLKTSSSKDVKPTTAIQFVRKHMITKYSMGPDQLDLTLGSRIIVKSEKSEKSEKLELQHTGDPFWKDRVSIAEPLVAVNNANEETNARLRGIAIHDALSKIQTPNDINVAVHSLVEQGRISDADVGLIITHITNLLERSELKPLFAKGMRIRNEADIQLENGHWLRPDRVVSQGQKSWVIDYKTGGERPEHKRQIEEYRSAMNELGFEEVKGLLVYLDSEKVVHV
jgi:ATP-dependent exoDNAse (exonuclease V) beta subunit